MIGAMKTLFIVVTILAVGVQSHNAHSVDYSQQLNSKLSKHREDVAYLKTHGREKLDGHYEKSKETLLNTIFALVHSAKNSEANSLCSGKFYETLESLPYEVYFRWDACIRLPTAMRKYGELVKDMEADFIVTESIVCNGVQTVANCDGNWFSKAYCAARTFFSVLTDYESKSKGIAYYVCQFDNLFHETVELSKECFSMGLTTTTDLILTAVNEYC